MLINPIKKPTALSGFKKETMQKLYKNDSIITINEYNNIIAQNHNIYLQIKAFSAKLYNFIKNSFTKIMVLDYINGAVAKSAAGRRKPNYSVAHSTPNKRVFLCKTYLPTMVLCVQQRLIVGCISLNAVFYLDSQHRHIVENKAVTLNNLSVELLNMFIFTFACIKRADLSNKIQKIKITAPTELQARSILAKHYVLVFAGQIPSTNGGKLYAPL